MSKVLNRRVTILLNEGEYDALRELVKGHSSRAMAVVIRELIVKEAERLGIVTAGLYDSANDNGKGFHRGSDLKRLP